MGVVALGLSYVAKKTRQEKQRVNRKNGLRALYKKPFFTEKTVRSHINSKDRNDLCQFPSAQFTPLLFFQPDFGILGKQEISQACPLFDNGVRIKR